MKTMYHCPITTKTYMIIQPFIWTAQTLKEEWSDTATLFNRRCYRHTTRDKNRSESGRKLVGKMLENNSNQLTWR